MALSPHHLKILYSFVLIFFFTLTNSVDPDEMLHYAAFIVCKSFPNIKG